MSPARVPTSTSVAERDRARQVMGDLTCKPIAEAVFVFDCTHSTLMQAISDLMAAEPSPSPPTASTCPICALHLKSGMW